MGKNGIKQDNNIISWKECKQRTEKEQEWNGRVQKQKDEAIKNMPKLERAGQREKDKAKAKKTVTKQERKRRDEK